jgi:hypothetical protein
MRTGPGPTREMVVDYQGGYWFEQERKHLGYPQKS